MNAHFDIRISKSRIRSSTFGYTYSIGAWVRNRRAIPKAAWLLPPELTRREGVLIASRPLRLRSVLFVKLRAYFVILGATCVAQLKELIRSLIGTRLPDRYYTIFEFRFRHTCCFSFRIVSLLSLLNIWAVYFGTGYLVLKLWFVLSVFVFTK